ncbi:MAG: phosphomannomutase/phosphoglucomutase [Bacilli bacterium]|nr:phosphomannomutase/phosphoglucomutase [Bacilli bacterium]MBR6137507.1 phosphomannomutase/phosphoglucomutase [Bacilli bacterium]
MEYKKDINTNIFRGYDIRGIYPTEIDEDTAYTIGLGFGTHIKRMGKTKCVIGHDNRLSREVLTNALIKGITETGIDVIYLDLCTTPMYYYACIKLQVYSGVMVTASHNPKDDNGFKFAFDESGNCKGQEIQDFLAEIQEGNFEQGNGTVENYDITEDYINLFKENLHFGPRRVKAVIDPGNGTTGIIARKIYELFPIDLTFINEESDGNFPNHHPDPCVEKNLDQLKAKVLEINADVGLSFDGDGDRMGMVSENAKFIPTDKYMIIIVRDIINKVEKKTFLCDVKCSKSFTDEVEKLGGTPFTYRTGNSYTKAKVREDNLPFGGELSGHVYFRDRWPGFDSGLYAGLRLLEIMSNTDKNVEDLLDGINEYYSTEELKFASPDNIKFEVIDEIGEYVRTKGLKFIDIDGIKVLYDDGWALVRASNTGPNITARFEASTKERLEEIQKEYTDLIEKLNQ